MRITTYTCNRCRTSVVNDRDGNATNQWTAPLGIDLCPVCSLEYEELLRRQYEEQREYLNLKKLT